ncbi:restriction endonuclease subunit S [Alicyclobacillus herbarius]|uniref:restriction endonuclease subunit S n=1 Tax=Alicyclobacillus herbarius TaxID=122960 RepID=UPI00041C6A15|nr:restriction endonuclease subunit S [Alicyclobacillus herbarius]
MKDSFWNICLLHEITSRDQLLREAARVGRTKQELEQTENGEEISSNPEQLFRFMKEGVGEREFGHFPGDQDLFFKLYHAGKDLDLLEYACETLRRDRVTGTVMVHPGIVERFIETCRKRRYQSLLFCEAEKYIWGLMETKCYLQPFSMTLLTQNYVLGRLLKTYFDPFPNVTVIQGSIYQPLPLETRFDAILTIPDFGTKVSEGLETTTREAEAVAINHLLPLLRGGGRLSTTLPARVVFQSGDIAAWRQKTNEQAPVHSIYALPEGLFRPFTSVKTYQVEFGNTPPDEVVLGRFALESTKLVPEQQVSVHPDKFRLLDNWRIDVLLDVNEDVLRDYQQAATPKVKLRDVADIFRGKSILKQDIKAGNIRVLNISNLQDGEVDLRGLDTIDEEERKVKRYEILPGDLVITCRGTVTKLAVFPETDGMVIASANILVLRFKKAILSHFAKIFLESPTGTALIQRFQRGTTVMNLNAADVGDIEVPLISEEQQRSIIERYLKEKERYLSAIRDATTRWEQVKNQLYCELY